MPVTAERLDVAKKPKAKSLKRYGVMVRVSDEFADALKDATSLERVSAADFCNTHLLPIVRKRYREVILKKAKEAEGGAK
jgi:hypothetical protein